MPHHSMSRSTVTPAIPPLNTTLLFHFSDQADDDDDEYDNEQPQVVAHQGQRQAAKSSGACVDCKSVKVRCEYVPGERKCRRCESKNLPCRPRERKKRKPADTHEQLQEKALEKDRKIQSLLLQYDKLISDQKIRGWITKSGLPEFGLRSNHKGKSPEFAAATYFHGGQGLHQLTPPDIIRACGLFPEEITDLFQIFFDKINPYFSILDPELHTPQNLIWTCPFLFTVICAISSRFYEARPGLYPLAMDFARDVAGNHLVDGRRSVDVCQAFLLLAVYPVPKKKWAEDRSWLLMGVAIRMAMELELNQPPPPTCGERESLNRTRTWLNCYCVDGSHAIQFGKIPMLRLDDYIARTSRSWYQSSTINTPFDVHLCAYVQVIMIMANWRNTMSRVANQPENANFDIVTNAIQTQERLSQELDVWVRAYDEANILLPIPICYYRGNTTQMITAYLRLVVLAVGFQHSVKRGLSRHSEIVIKAIDAARTVIQIMIERLYPTGYLRYAMDANFLYVSFAAAFLINFLRPKFLPLLDENQQREIILIVKRLISILSSSDVALDGRHTPALYSRFLSSLLEKHHTKIIQAESQAGSSSHSSSYAMYPEDRQPTPPNVYYWPDIGHAAEDSGPLEIGDLPDGMIYQQDGDADMDLSLIHFVRTVSQDLPAQTHTQVINSTNQWHNLIQRFSDWYRPNREYEGFH